MGTDSIHDFYLTGADYGANMSGYTNNFAWGVLDVTGNFVHFHDGNSDAGAALYLREIVGLEITNLMIANLFGFDGLDIYYLANLPGNVFLNGLTYSLAGGGHLVPIHPIPEPSTMLLLGTGLAVLVGFGRRRLMMYECRPVGHRTPGNVLTVRMSPGMRPYTPRSTSSRAVPRWGGIRPPAAPGRTSGPSSR